MEFLHGWFVPFNLSVITPCFLHLQVVKGEFIALPLLEKEIYAPLRNLNFFMKARVEGDSVVWNDEIDVAPEHLYEYSLPTKEIDS